MLYHKKRSLLISCIYVCIFPATPCIAVDVANDPAAAAAMFAAPNSSSADYAGIGQAALTGLNIGPVTKMTAPTSNTMGAYQGWISNIQRKPVLEILYAWLGYDQWESYGAYYAHTTKRNTISQPITNAVSAASFSDVTTQLQLTLERGVLLPGSGTTLKGALYLARTAPTPLAPRSRGGRMHPNEIAGYNEKNVTKNGCLLPDGALASCGSLNDPRTLGIVYRDADGIHFRRFEGWQNAALPMISSVTLGTANNQPHTNSGLFYGHQLEEIGRGLVTATTTATGPLNFLALDRFGWGTTFHDGITFCPGVYIPADAAGNDCYFLRKHPREKGWFESPQSLNLFRFNWGNSGSTLDLKGSAFAAFPSDNPKGRSPYLTSIPQYKYYNESEQLITLPLPGAPASPGNADPSINTGQAGAIPFPGANETEVDVWFAFDQTESGPLFTLGTGCPEDESDFLNDAKSVRILYQKNVVTSPYIRYFGFSPDDGKASIYNIRSKRLNKKKKFRTPPFSNGKFLFWLKEWEATTPDAFGITFSASGTSIHVGLSTLAIEDRLNERKTFDLGYDYAIRLNTQPTTNLAASPIVVEKRIPNSSGKPGLPPTDSTVIPLPVKLISILPEVSIESYKDYWITYNDGLIEIGLGQTPGKQILAVALDREAPSNVRSFCFSGGMRTTDYRNISCQPYYIVQSVTTPNLYTSWSPAQQFKNKALGGFIFGYQLASTPAQAADAGSTPVADPDAVVMIGLNNGIPDDSAVPYYQIKLGTDTNTSHQIFSQSNLSKTMVAAPVLTLENGWQKAWLMYENGMIAYGTGETLGKNLLCRWQDPTVTSAKPSPAYGVDSFCFTSPSTAMSFMVQSQPQTASYTTYLAKPSDLSFSHPLWQWLTPNQGGIAFSATGLTTSMLQIGWTDANNTLSDPICECIINDKGGAYFKESATQQASVKKLAFSQIPSATPTGYWLLWDNGFFVLGAGRDPLNLDSVLVKWQSTKAAPPINRLTLAAQNSFVRYSAITLLDPAKYKSILTALKPTSPPTLNETAVATVSEAPPLSPNSSTAPD